MTTRSSCCSPLSTTNRYVCSSLNSENSGRVIAPSPKPLFPIVFTGITIWDLVTDGSFFYICGTRVRQDDSVSAYVYKVDMQSGAVAAIYEDVSGTLSFFPFFLSVTVDGSYVYATGARVESSIRRALTVCLSKATLSEVWRDVRQYNAGGTLNAGSGLLVDGASLYVCGNYAYHGGQRAFRLKLNKDTGAQLWLATGVYSGYSRITNYSTTHIDISGSGGGVRFFQRVHKTNNVATEYKNYNPQYYNHYDNRLYGGVYYTAGVTGLAPFISLVAAFNPANLTQLWAWTSDLATGGRYEYTFGVCPTSQGIFGLGRVEELAGSGISRMYLVKLNFSGVQQWLLYHEQLRVTTYWGILEMGGALYIGTYNNDPSIPDRNRPAYIEKRSLIDGSLIP